MEYLKVLVRGHEDEDISVVLNRRKSNRKTGNVLTVSRGYVRVSVDLPGAVEKRELVTGTRPTAPHVTEIEIADADGGGQDDGDEE